MTWSWQRTLLSIQRKCVHIIFAYIIFIYLCVRVAYIICCSNKIGKNPNSWFKTSGSAKLHCCRLPCMHNSSSNGLELPLKAISIPTAQKQHMSTYGTQWHHFQLATCSAWYQSQVPQALDSKQPTTIHWLAQKRSWPPGTLVAFNLVNTAQTESWDFLYLPCYGNLSAMPIFRRRSGRNLYLERNHEEMALCTV